MNYYQFHVGDYAVHTRHLSLMEDLAYRRLLDLYYTSERPIPLDTEKVAKLVGMRDHIREVSEILSDFFLKSDDGYRNKRCDEEIAAYRAKADRARSANQSRWGRNNSDSRLTSDQKSDADQIPTKNHEPRTNTSSNEDVGAKDSRTVNVTAQQMVSVASGLTLETATEYLRYRKAIKKPLTPRAWSTIAKEIRLAGWLADAALAEAMAAGWQGLKADWLKNRGGQHAAGRTTARSHEHGDEVGRRWAEEERQRELQREHRGDQHPVHDVRPPMEPQVGENQRGPQGPVSVAPRPDGTEGHGRVFEGRAEKVSSA